MSVFERMQASRPVNRQAAQVIAKGQAYAPAKRIDQVHSAEPLAVLTAVEVRRRSRDQPGFLDLTGMSCGRFRVIGVYAENPGNECGRWVVRCACGSFETRKRKAILNPRNDLDRCDYCRHLLHLKRQSQMLSYGKNVGGVA